MLRRLFPSIDRAHGGVEAQGAVLERIWTLSERSDVKSRLSFSTAVTAENLRPIPQLPREFILRQAIFDKRMGTPEYAAAMAEVDKVVAKLLGAHLDDADGLASLQRVRTTPSRSTGATKEAVEIITPAKRAELATYWESKASICTALRPEWLALPDTFFSRPTASLHLVTSSSTGGTRAGSESTEHNFSAPDLGGANDNLQQARQNRGEVRFDRPPLLPP